MSMDLRILKRPDGTPLPNEYFLERSVDRRKLDRIIANLAHACGIEAVRVARAAKGSRQDYCIEGDRWIQAIDMIDDLAKRMAER